MKGSMIVRHALVYLLLTAMLAGSAQAADSCRGTLNAEEIRNCLAPIKTRGIKRGITIEGEQPPPRETTVNLTVNFDFNSSRLSNDGMISLDALGKALSDPSLRDEHFRISGHTDAVGSDSYNQRLSEERALAVRAYLEQYHRLDPNHFDVVGYGRTQLYDAADPTAAINRRVQVTKLAR